MFIPVLRHFPACGQKIDTEKFLCAFFRKCLDLFQLARHLARSCLCVINVSGRSFQDFFGRIQNRTELGKFPS